MMLFLKQGQTLCPRTYRYQKGLNADIAGAKKFQAL